MSLRGCHQESGQVSFPALGAVAIDCGARAPSDLLQTHLGRCIQVANEACQDASFLSFCVTRATQQVPGLLGASVSGKMSRSAAVIFKLSVSSETLSLNKRSSEAKYIRQMRGEPLVAESTQHRIVTFMQLVISNKTRP